MNELFEAIFDLRFDRLRQLTQRPGVNVNGYYDGGTPLGFACAVGSVEAAKILLEAGANPNALDERYGQSPLHFAADQSVDLVKLLLEAHANVDQRDVNGMTPLMVAAKGGHLDIVDVLVVHDADVGLFDEHHQSPLHWSAVGGEYPEVNAYLLKAGADPDAVTAYGKTYLEILSDLRAARAN
jgi:ankyrin repeat protein